MKKEFIDSIDYKDYKDTERYKLGTTNVNENDGSDIIVFSFLFVWLCLIIFASVIYVTYNLITQ